MNKTMMTVLMMSFAAVSAYSCELDVPRDIKLFTSLTKGETRSFSDERSLLELPLLRAFNCQKLALKKRYIMLGFGPEINEYSNAVPSRNINGDITSNMCTIENKPDSLTNLSFAEKLIGFNKKIKYFQKCVEFVIEDEGRRPLVISEEQAGCKVNKVTNHKAIIEGGYCFFKPNVGSSYTIKLGIKKECQSATGLSNLDLFPSDIKGALNFYTASDDTGNATDLTAVQGGDVNVRLVTSSDPTVIRSSKDYNGRNPSFPSQWVNPNIYMGPISIADTGGNRYKIKTPILVDNRCKSVCKDKEVCYSPCNYTQPVAFQNKLYRLRGDKKPRHLTSWYDGGVALPGFQGFVESTGFEIPISFFHNEDVYRLEMRFNDPKFDFEKFKSRLERRWGELEQHLPSITRRSQGIPEIPEVNEVNPTRELPDIAPIQGINFEDRLDGVAGSIDQLKSFFSSQLWPPYYKESCSVDLQTCISPSSDKTKITLLFRVIKESATKKVEIKVISVKRESKLLADYSATSLPFLNCNQK